MPLVDSLTEIAAILASSLRSSGPVAVLGMKTEEQANQPAFYVPAYAKRAGLTIIPVPVYYPDVKEILGVPVHRSLASIEGPVDIVDVFRRPSDIPAHVDDILAKMPRVVWFQSGIRNDDVARVLSDKGISVVQDHCLMVELERIGR